MAEVAKKENAWSMIKLGLVLCAYAVVACAMLAVVNNFTAPKIAQNQERKVSQAMAEFFPDSGLTFETVNDFTPPVVGAITVDELYVADRDYLLFYIRSGSFVAADNAFKFKIDNCANCGNPATFDIRLDNIQLDEIKSFSKKFVIFGKEIEIRPPRMSDKQYNLKDLELTRLLNYTNIAEVFGSVESGITNVS